MDLQKLNKRTDSRFWYEGVCKIQYMPQENAAGAFWPKHWTIWLSLRTFMLWYLYSHVNVKVVTVTWICTWLLQRIQQDIQEPFLINNCFNWTVSWIPEEKNGKGSIAAKKKNNVPIIGCPTKLLEFVTDQVHQVINNAEYIFSIWCTEICWHLAKKACSFCVRNIYIYF